MKREKMFKKGGKIQSMQHLIATIDSKHWIFMRHKPLHFSFIMSMTLRTLMNIQKAGGFYYAIRSNEGLRGKNITTVIIDEAIN